MKILCDIDAVHSDTVMMINVCFHSAVLGYFYVLTQHGPSLRVYILRGLKKKKNVLLKVVRYRTENEFKLEKIFQKA